MNTFCSDLVVECHFHYLSYIHPQAQNSPNLALRFHHLVLHMRATHDNKTWRVSVLLVAQDIHNISTEVYTVYYCSKVWGLFGKKLILLFIKDALNV